MAIGALRNHLLTLFEQTRGDVAAFAAFAASRSDERGASHDLIALIGFWMEYNIERIGYFARDETPPREVDFDALTQAALTENASRSWAETIAYTETAFDHLVAAVTASSEALLMTDNVYGDGLGDGPGGPSWEEIRANGFTWPLQEMEKVYLASGETERAAALRAQLTAEHGEDQPIICDLMEPAVVNAQRNELLVIDVRGSSDYAAGHLPGARNIPLATLAERLGDLPREQQIVTYCNMGHPGHSRGEQAAALLSERGYRAAALAGGYPNWREQGLTVEHCSQK